jgi:phthiodiolone/phenolphthiodiolone dimycocerosates ketoreductase
VTTITTNQAEVLVTNPIEQNQDSEETNVSNPKPLEIAVPVTTTSSRFIPPSVAAEQAAMLHASGLVDYVQTYDQVSGFFPRSLWNARNAPLAGVLPDLDSQHDPFALSTYLLACNPEAGLICSTDAVRRGPVELAQTLLSWSTMTTGKVMLQMGAGEVRQLSPGGWKRAWGLPRLEDQLKMWHAIWDGADSPVTLEGTNWNLKDAFLGSARPANRPALWTLGGGPKLIDLTTSYADGVNVAIPGVQSRADEYGEWIVTLRKDVANKDRDPDSFSFGGWPVMLVHDDENVIDRALDNPLIRWVAAIWGRFNNREWEREGVTSAFPEDWHYSVQFRPMALSDTDAQEILSRTTREMAEKAVLWGTPAQVAEQIQPFVDRGVSWLSLTDFLPMVLEQDDAARWPERTLEVARILKSTQAATLATAESRPAFVN